MSESQEITVLVRDRERTVQFVAVDETEAAVVMAAASSDPRCWRELGYAWLRYFPDKPLEQLPWVPCVGKCPIGRWLVMDLARQRLVSNDPDFIPTNPGAFRWDQEGESPLLEAVWFNLPPWWESVCSRQFQGALLPLPELTEPLDFRGVLFGRTMADALAEEMLRLAQSDGLPSEAAMSDEFPWNTVPTDKEREIRDQWHRLTVRVHAAWLMTPRVELEGQTPRYFLHHGRDWVDREIQHRVSEWSMFKRPPRALDRDTFAYRHGPMALDEVALYFDLCRVMLHDGWELLCRQDMTCEDLGRAMYASGQQWLETGRIDSELTHPAEIIETSRRHMPQLSDGMPLDCDCPICRQMAEDQPNYPTFVSFDGHHLELEDEFAFSLYESREEWQESHEEMQSFDEEFQRFKGSFTNDVSMFHANGIEECKVEADDELEDDELEEEELEDEDALEDRACPPFGARPESSRARPKD